MIEVTAKKWGNSLGLVIPKSVVDELGLHEGAKLTVHFNQPKKTVLEEIWGAYHFEESTEELLAETRRGFSKWIK